MTNSVRQISSTLSQSDIVSLCLCFCLVLFAVIVPTDALAVETVCARVKIEIKQELTLERQAFDAEMKINNTTADGVINNVSIDVKVFDENSSHDGVC